MIMLGVNTCCFGRRFPNQSLGDGPAVWVEASNMTGNTGGSGAALASVSGIVPVSTAIGVGGRSRSIGGGSRAAWVP